MSEFDPYHKWFGIPPREQPPNYYRLLSIELFEEDADVIDLAANKQMQHLKQFASGPQSDISQKLLNEVATARLCLLNPARRAAYDAELKKTLGAVRPRMPAPVHGTPHSQAGDSGRAIASSPAAGGHETKRPSDSVPMTSGSFEKLPLRFGRYEVQKLLGRGGMGAVYLALDTQLDRPVALKIPKVSASGSKKLLQRLETEARAAAQLDHPGACKVYDCGAIDNICYIALQYIEGETLKTLLKDRGKSSAEVVSLILQVAEALADAHDLGIIHRDLKPENVMINRRGMAVVMDFGLAKLTKVAADAAATQAGTIMGSPAYMSPEQALGEASQVTGQTDIYALGVILYELLTGRWPFMGQGLQIMGQKTLQDPPSPLSVQPDLHPRLAAVCQKMIAKNRTDRYLSFRAVIADLKSLDLEAGLPELPEASTLIFPDVGDERPSSIVALSARTQSQSPGKTAAVRWSQQLAALWRQQSPVVRWTALGGAAMSLMWGMILLFSTKHGIVVIEVADPSLSVRFQGDTITVENDGRPIRVTPTEKHTLEVLQDGLTIESASRELTLSKGETRMVTISLPPESPPAPAQTAKHDKSGWHGWPADAPPPAIAPFNAQEAKKHQTAWAEYLRVPAGCENTMGMKFALIPPGEFVMGSTQDEIDDAVKNFGPWWTDRLIYVRSEAPQHAVILTKPIFMGIHEVTQGQYESVLKTNPSWFIKDGPGKPWSAAVEGLETASLAVDNLGWHDAAEFCAKLSLHEKLKPFYFRSGSVVTHLNGDGYRLPTEAEWEFSCRAGTTSQSPAAQDARFNGWCNSNAGGRTHAVGELKPNPFGLFDMQGNVWEWVHDSWESNGYSQFEGKPALDPRGPLSTSLPHMLRGGDWNSPRSMCRPSSRYFFGLAPPYAGYGPGLRVSLAVSTVKLALESRTMKPTDVSEN